MNDRPGRRSASDHLKATRGSRAQNGMLPEHVLLHTGFFGLTASE